MSSSKAIGIDLGTSYSSVAVWKNDRCEIIKNNEGNGTTPSYIAFSDDGRLFGEAAKAQVVMNPSNTVFNVMRLLGQKYDSYEVQYNMKYFPFQVLNRGGRPIVAVQHLGEKRELHTEQVLSMILENMKRRAEVYLGSVVSNAVVSVPAMFNDSQRQAIRDAGTIGGLNVLRIISHPVNAAMTYGMQTSIPEEFNILVFDLGGGTCDVAILTIEEGIHEVKAIAGDTHLGGEDFDNRLVSHFIEEFKQVNKKDISSSPRAVLRLRMACERAKCDLSFSTVVKIEIKSLFEGIDFHTWLTRSTFETLCNGLFNRVLDPIKQALEDVGMNKSNIHEIILVGGSTRIPRIVELISDFFNGKKPNLSLNPDETVACGAAIQAAILSGDTSEKTQEFLLLDVAPLSLGISIVAKSPTFSGLSDDMETTLVNTPFSLGVKTAGDVVTSIIKCKTKTPAIRSELFSTYSDNQQNVSISVYEGERARIKDNQFLGGFQLRDISPAPRGVPRIEVTFEFHANSILRVMACNKTASKYSALSKVFLIPRHPNALGEKIAEETKQYKVEDEAFLAQNALRLYASDIRSTSERLDTAVKEALMVLHSGGEASEPFDDAQTRLRGVVNDITEKLSLSAQLPPVYLHTRTHGLVPPPACLPIVWSPTSTASLVSRVVVDSPESSESPSISGSFLALPSYWNFPAPLGSCTSITLAPSSPSPSPSSSPSSLPSPIKPDSHVHRHPPAQLIDIIRTCVSSILDPRTVQRPISNTRYPPLQPLGHTPAPQRPRRRTLNCPERSQCSIFQCLFHVIRVRAGAGVDAVAGAGAGAGRAREEKENKDEAQEEEGVGVVVRVRVGPNGWGHGNRLGHAGRKGERLEAKQAQDPRAGEV
ncbi:unnamed protein product [Cyclocybe aegerita]|uniref:non-chaperonin molecular chaperone ATPase n=1 Tax=Cyclocybe aegerita TaxID=1973307 RepID=A0A8S0WCA5_CYCAE|nr:unnamed protein product [Cyclocybe aegerita]